jgi:hypothetical protein
MKVSEPVPNTIITKTELIRSLRNLKAGGTWGRALVTDKGSPVCVVLSIADYNAVMELMKSLLAENIKLKTQSAIKGYK